jgi:non-specific serine/threonine protein kinase
MELADSQGDARDQIYARAAGWSRLALYQGDHARAIALGQEVLTWCREHGSVTEIEEALHNLANGLQGRGDHARAIELLDEALDLSQNRNGTPGAYLLDALALSTWALGDEARAERCWRQSLPKLRALGDRLNAAYRLEGMAALAASHGRADDAARLLGAASVLPGLSLARQLPVDRAIYECALSAREHLGERAWAAAWEEGRSWSLDEAVEYALGMPELSAAASPPRPQSS